jgi:replicative superfamily II helicase
MNYSTPYEYPYCDFDFDEWNPVQLKCVPFFTEDCNLVVSASTASGKTVIAEAIMGYELARTPSSKTVYVSPLKAIGNEKHGDWRKHPTFREYPIVIVSSENDVTQGDFENSRLIVSTVESMNLRCRAKDRWIKDISVLVFDEAHLLMDESRGSGSESLIMNVTMLNPKCRIVCLSGTMSNYIEIARWLKACNQKTTRYVNSDWRPTELVKSVEMAEDFDEQSKFILQEARRMVDEDKKMLVFVHSKVVGENMCKFLRDYNVSCAFYHSGVMPKAREAMIADFRNEYSGLHVLVCTSSLGMGVTL